MFGYANGCYLKVMSQANARLEGRCHFRVVVVGFNHSGDIETQQTSFLNFVATAELSLIYLLLKESVKYYK